MRCLGYSDSFVQARFSRLSRSAVIIILLKSSFLNSAVVYPHGGVCKVHETREEIQSCALTWRSIEELKVINPGEDDKHDHSELWLAQTLQHAADISLISLTLYIIFLLYGARHYLSHSYIIAVCCYDNVLLFLLFLLFVQSDVCFCWSLDAVWLIIECVCVSDCSMNLLFIELYTFISV